jgi:hypothetical protein
MIARILKGKTEGFTQQQLNPAHRQLRHQMPYCWLFQQQQHSMELNPEHQHSVSLHSIHKLHKMQAPLQLQCKLVRLEAGAPPYLQKAIAVLHSAQQRQSRKPH